MPSPVTIYRTRDGQRFDSETEAKAYERENFAAMLVGLTPEQLAAALSREDRDLADALERAGDAVKKVRLDDGELRRKRSPKEAVAEAAQGEATTGAPAGTEEEA